MESNTSRSEELTSIALSVKDKMEHVKKINFILQQLALDQRFHENLQLEVVKRAINHW